MKRHRRRASHVGGNYKVKGPEAGRSGVCWNHSTKAILVDRTEKERDGMLINELKDMEETGIF